MEQEIRDYLGVPGHVVMFTFEAKKDLLKQALNILGEFEKQGYFKIHDVPECKEKSRLYEIFGILKIKIGE